jgi:hypothetical protein
MPDQFTSVTLPTCDNDGPNSEPGITARPA